MGKDSLIKSTSKKKNDKEKEEKKKAAKVASAAKKKTAAKSKSAPKAKKTPVKKASAKKTEAKKTTVKKTSPKKTETKKKTAASAAKPSPKKKKSVASAPKQKAAVRKKKPVSRSELLMKTFDVWAPATPFRSESDTKESASMTAPPYITGETAADIDRKKALLFKTFDLGAGSLSAPVTGGEGATGSDIQTPPPPPPPPVMTKGSDPMATAMKLCIVGFVLLVAILVRFSTSNQARYYLKPAADGVEIWKGVFAPMGEERMLLLPGAEGPEAVQAVYARQEIFPIVFNYYVKKADDLLEIPGMPDFEGIKANLDRAMPFATTKKLQNIAIGRRNIIDLMILLYKAEVAASKETIQDYEAALEYLKDARAFDVGGSKSDLINQKFESINAAMIKLKAVEAKAEEPPSSPPDAKKETKP